MEQRGGKCHVYKCDLTDREDVYAVADRVKAEVGTVDVLINNAGIVSGSYFLDTPDSEFSGVISAAHRRVHVRLFIFGAFNVVWCIPECNQCRLAHITLDAPNINKRL